MWHALRTGFWTKVGAIGTILGVVVALLVALGLSGSGSEEPEQPSARVTLRAPVPNNAVVPVAVADLPEPPPYVPDGADAQESHCAEWNDWLQQQGAASFSAPALTLSAPADAPATITALRFTVHRAERPRALTLVQCVYGAGGFEPTVAAVDLSRPDHPPVLRTVTRGDIGPIPDATFTVAAGRTETLAFEPTGTDGVFYEWGAEVDVIVDQKTTTLTFGPPNQPFRSYFGDTPAGVDFDMRTRRWARGGPFQ